MAYYVDSALTYGAAVTGVAQNVPAHEINDILFMWIVVNVGTVPLITAGTGWSVIVAEITNAAHAGFWAWKRATSNAEAISITTADDYTTAIHCIRDVDVTTAIDVSAQSGSATATSTPDNAAVTTTTGDCLVLYLMAVDGIAVAHHANPGVHHITSFDNGSTTANTSSCQGGAWYIQRAAGLTPAPAWTCSLAGAVTQVTVAFRNKAGGAIPAYIDDVSSPATVVTPAHHYTTLNNISYPTALTSTANINGKTVAYLVGTAAADLGIVPFSNGISPAASLIAQTALNGYEMALTGNRNWSTGLIMGSLIGGTPKMGTFGAGTVKDGGFVIRIGSSATAWCAYQVAAKDSVPTLESRSVFVIQPGYTGSAYGTPGTAVLATAVSHMQFLRNAPYFASQLVASEIYQVFKQVVAGGDAVSPVNTDGMASIGKSFRLPVIQKFGGSGLLSYAPIQIGGGDAVNFQINAGALQFPSRYNVATKEIGYHAADNAVGISYAGKLGDVVKHTNSVITSPTSYYWEINAAATSAATWDFAGLVVVNAVVTLRNVMTFTEMAFSACGSITATGCTLTNSKISRAPAASASFVATSGTFSKLAVNLASLTAGNHWWTGANPTLFSDCAFIGGGGHAIRITTSGTYAFVGNTFSGFGIDGSTGAAILNESGGLVTINVSGGGSTPTVTNVGVATTTVNNSKVLTLTGLVTGSDVVIKTSNTNTELVDVDANVGSTYAYSYTFAAGTYVDVKIMLPGYVPFTVYNYLLGATDASLPIAQTLDRAYQ